MSTGNSTLTNATIPQKETQFSRIHNKVNDFNKQLISFSGDFENYIGNLIGIVPAEALKNTEGPDSNDRIDGLEYSVDTTFETLIKIQENFNRLQERV